MSRESDLEQLRDQASAAYAAGQSVFVVRLAAGLWGTPGKGAMEPWGESVSAVESVGWRLAEWTVTTDTSGHFNAFPLFRRGVPQDAIRG
ncbi:hypothetical protein [Lapillicoccus sp.]|uniref:hypothetical protein n=1 Tax=Lapillicoccus sp. TaxID=1909287 RepID=UPI0025FA02E1|nr:hypothetical protein [Lapillicoccus sp.]